MQQATVNWRTGDPVRAQWRANERHPLPEPAPAALAHEHGSVKPDYAAVCFSENDATWHGATLHGRIPADEWTYEICMVSASTCRKVADNALRLVAQPIGSSGEPTDAQIVWAVRRARRLRTRAWRFEAVGGALRDWLTYPYAPQTLQTHLPYLTGEKEEGK